MIQVHTHFGIFIPCNGHIQENNWSCTLYHFSEPGSSALRYNSRYNAQNDATSLTQRQGQFGTLTRRHRPSLDYASDTEATCSSSPRSAYYYYRHNINNPTHNSAVSHLATLSRTQIAQTAAGKEKIKKDTRVKYNFQKRLISRKRGLRYFRVQSVFNWKREYTLALDNVDSFDVRDPTYTFI